VLWVIVFAAIAVAGLVMLVCYGVWLAHKTADVLSEGGGLDDRGAQLGELLGQIQAPQAAREPREADGSLLVRVPGDLTGSDVR